MGEKISPELWSQMQHELEKIGGFQDYAALLMDQIKRRVLNGETIPTAEKIYFVFQPHTERVSKVFSSGLARPFAFYYRDVDRKVILDWGSARPHN